MWRRSVELELADFGYGVLIQLVAKSLKKGKRNTEKSVYIDRNLYAFCRNYENKKIMDINSNQTFLLVRKHPQVTLFIFKTSPDV